MGWVLNGYRFSQMALKLRRSFESRTYLMCAGTRKTKTMGNSEQRSFNPINLSIRLIQRLIIGQKMSVRFDKFRDQIRLALPVCDRARAREYFI